MTLITDMRLTPRKIVEAFVKSFFVYKDGLL